MKKCPQFNSGFGVESVYFSDNGEVLIEENLSLTSEYEEVEADIIIHRDPIVVDFGETTSPTEGFENIQNIPPTQPIIFEQKRVSRNYAIFLILGLLLGGVLVLATHFAAKCIYRPNKPEITVKNKNQNTEALRSHLRVDRSVSMGEKLQFYKLPEYSRL